MYAGISTNYRRCPIANRLVVSVRGATVKPKINSALEAGAMLTQFLCQETAESLNLSGLGITYCRAMRNVGRMLFS